MDILRIVALLLVACTMAFSLAHAAELPGKMRLDRPTYLAVQRIYHPGFTVGGISEPLAILALAALGLLESLPPLVACSLGFVVAMQVVYWLAVHPVNRFWLSGETLPRASAGFFGLGKAPDGTDDNTAWTRLRARWEYAHALRAALSATALVLLAVHVVFAG